MSDYTTLRECFRHDAVIEHSDFLAFAHRADTPEEALEQLTILKTRYPDATHLCWAYKIGGLYRFHDDGEPGGTAGAPILRAIEGQGLDHVMVVVVRFYGGVKLGTGGLARAYGGTAAECLRLAEREEIRARVLVHVSIGFAHLNTLFHLLEGWNVIRDNEEYNDTGLSLDVALFPEDKDDFTNALRDSTRGTAIIHDL